MRFLALAVAVSCAVGTALPQTLSAQAAAPAPGATLTLTDAVALARRNNPGLQNTLNARRTASAQLRSATGAFLPSVSTNFSTDYREGRQQLFQGQAFGSTNDQLNTNVSGSVNLNLSMSQLSDRRAAKAGVEATEADISVAEQQLRVNVTNQYLLALQQQARATLQDTLLVTTQAQLDLAKAKLQVGSGTELDVQRAEVTNGQQRVAALTAHTQADIEKIRLFQQMGIAPVMGTRLESNLPVVAPTQTIDQIIAMTQKSNPNLEAARARTEQASRQVSSARRQYYPSLNISSGMSGYTNHYTDTDLLIQSGQASAVSQKASCIRSEEVRAAVGLTNNLAACNGITFTPAAEAAIRDAQSKYPFSFARNPYSVSASLSLPIFNGFRREQQVEQASVQRKNAENDLRSQELRVNADVTTAWMSLTTSQQAVTLQEQNARTARLALSLAQERYRVGTISLVELVQARGDFDRAETDRISAVYDFHRAFTQLEAAVGRPLR